MEQTFNEMLTDLKKETELMRNDTSKFRNIIEKWLNLLTEGNKRYAELKEIRNQLNQLK